MSLWAGSWAEKLHPMLLKRRKTRIKCSFCMNLGDDVLLCTLITMISNVLTKIILRATCSTLKSWKIDAIVDSGNSRLEPAHWHKFCMKALFWMTNTMTWKFGEYPINLENLESYFWDLPICLVIVKPPGSPCKLYQKAIQTGLCLTYPLEN